MSIDKIIVTNGIALTNKYGVAGLKKIQAAIKKLIAADKKRLFISELILLDDKAAMKKFKSRPVLAAADEQENKNAIDDLYDFIKPDYIMILGGPDIVAHQMFVAFADDENVHSDLPYTCNKPFSKNPKDFLSPARVVGRLPDITGGTDVKYLLHLIGIATTAISRKAEEYHQYLALTVTWWQESTRQSLKNIFGNDTKLQLCPPAKSPYSAAALKPRVHFFNCHGGEDFPAFFGQLKEGDATPECFFAKDLKGKVTNGTVAAAECCFGAQLLDPTDTADGHMGVGNMYLGEGAYAFVGSTTSAYGPASGQGLADLITQYFIKNVQRGASAGRAFLEAQQKFITTSGRFIDRFELKTLCQFLLLADPSINPVIDTALIKANSSAKTIENKAQNEISDRKERRAQLVAKGKMLGDVTNAPQQIKAVPPPALKKQINAVLNKYDYKPEDGSTDGFKPKAGPDGTKSIGLSAKDIRFHIFPKVDDEKANKALSAGTVLVLKEINGKITEVREYVRK
ncbi:MAG: hypothetical protein V4722_18925 [Bacteroidota bacterium]